MEGDKEMNKLVNVIKGHLSREAVETINVISIGKMRVEFCGTLHNFRNPPDFMEEYQRGLMAAQVVKSEVNGTRLDCFIN